jgi:hypothetical protein
MKMIVSALISVMLVGGCLEPSTGKSAGNGTKNGSTTTNNSTGSDKNVNSASSGSKSNITQIVFGRFCGRCLSGKCAPMYKLDINKKELWLDNSNHYSEGVPLVFNEKLGEKQYRIAAQLPTKISDALLKSNEKRFGCPNCADQCGFYLEVTSPGKKHSYEIDTDTRALTGFAKTISEDLHQIITNLQQGNQLNEAK